jgi:hypothetical protein
MTTPTPAPNLPPLTRQQRLKAWARENSVKRRWEEWHPYAIAGVLFIVCLFITLDANTFQSVMKDLTPVAVSVAAIMAGFQGAMHAILLSASGSRKMKRLRTTDTFKLLMRYIRSGIVSLVIFVAVAMLIMTVYAVGKWPGLYRIPFALLLGTFAFSLASSLRIMLLLLSLIDDDDSAEAGAAGVEKPPAVV